LCGNANGDPWDDTSMANGELAEDTVELARSWKVTNESHCCSDGCAGDCGGRCRWDQLAKYKKKSSCGLLSHKLGPFRRCHSTLDPNIYLKNCVHDLCLSNGLQAALCQALQAYADDCHEEGIVLADWRTVARCPLSCPPNSFYTSCGTSCPSTCNDEALPSACNSSSCVETCQCLEGFVLDANQCVPKAQCGCVFEDLLYSHQEDFWGDATCTTRCSCDGEGQGAQCQGSSCQLGEECRVEEGLQGCHPKAYGTCVAFGATHYETFDGQRFIFQGSCVYQMVGLCKKSQELVDFQVLVQNGEQGEDLLASITGVTLKVYNKTIVISQENPNRVMLNHHLTNLPYHQHDGKISISRGGLEAVVELDFGLKVTYDWQSQVTISVPSTYSNSLCGLCGNFNGDLTDEMMTMDGQVTSNPDLLGHSWKVKDLPGCGEHSMVECPPSLVARWNQVASKKQCQILLQKDGPFGACHEQVDPKRYFQSCMHDACLFPGREDVLCPIAARYAAACRAAAVVVGIWRTEDFCGISCPPNSHYELCSQACSQTCSKLLQPQDLPKCPQKCQEGCSCDQGLVLSSDECVPASRCGCLHDDFYYKLEEIFFTTTTTVEKCQCQAGGTMSCEVLSCPGGIKGEVIDDVFQCPSEAPGVCMVTGDQSLMTFDGVAFNITGTCSYVLTETCGEHRGDEEQVTPFVVKIEKVARQKKKVSGIQEVTLEVYGLTVTLTQGKREVMVDSISHHLSTFLSQGRVQVYRHGLGILLQTNFGLLLHYDLVHQVTLKVPQLYQGHLCGLCGNFNSERGDDLLLPDGQIAPNTMLFASSWRTSPEPCSQDCPMEDCPPCSEKKMLLLQKANYCGIILDPKGPLEACHEVINPTWFFQACLHDLCQAQGDTQVLCSSVQSYATACQEAKVVIKQWRRPSFC
ncbi:FCGBP protein, partial [Bucco capensis]|nr:FCGBP protein [Bucco capensis]